MKQELQEEYQFTVIKMTKGRHTTHAGKCLTCQKRGKKVVFGPDTRKAMLEASKEHLFGEHPDLVIQK